MQTTLAQVFGETAQARDGLDDALGDERAGTAPAYEQASFHQPLKRLAYRDARYRQRARQIALAGQRLTTLDILPLHHIADRATQTQVGQRLMRSRITREQPVLFGQSSLHALTIPFKYQ